jgi:hypothetical protein
MSNRRRPSRRLTSTPPAEQADPEHGFDTPEAIEALERAAAELVQGTNLDPRELVRGLLSNEADRQVGERGVVRLQIHKERGDWVGKLRFSEPRNTAEVRLCGRSVQRLFKAELIFNEDEGDLSRFADREQHQPKRHDFYAKPGVVVERRRSKRRA